MDAIKFLKEKKRMCTLMVGCLNCPISILNNKFGEPCGYFEKKHPEDAVAIVEKWSKEHPIKTRQSEFLKMFPNTKVSNGVISICPKHIDSECGANCNEDCTKCRQNYWFAEID